MFQSQEAKSLDSNAEKSQPQWFEEDSEALSLYFNGLKAKGKEANAKSLCCLCWCLLSNYQKDRHIDKHDSGLRTPSLFCFHLEDFKSLAQGYGHFQDINGKRFFKRIQDEPAKQTQTGGHQTKKVKITALPPKNEEQK